MTKDEFIKEAIRRGLDKEETRRQFELLEAQGAFSDSSTKAPARDPSVLGRNLEAAVTGFMDPIYGASQVLYNTANDLGVAGPFKAIDSAAYDYTGGLFGSPGGDVNQQIRDRELAFQQSNGGSGGVRVSWKHGWRGINKAANINPWNARHWCGIWCIRPSDRH